MYTKLDIICIIVCIIVLVALYIYRKATNQMWYGIQWKNVWKCICKLFK